MCFILKKVIVECHDHMILCRKTETKKVALMLSRNRGILISQSMVNQRRQLEGQFYVVRSQQQTNNGRFYLLQWRNTTFIDLSCF